MTVEELVHKVMKICISQGFDPCEPCQGCPLKDVFCEVAEIRRLVELVDKVTL